MLSPQPDYEGKSKRVAVMTRRNDKIFLLCRRGKRTVEQCSCKIFRYETLRKNENKTELLSESFLTNRTYIKQLVSLTVTGTLPLSLDFNVFRNPIVLSSHSTAVSTSAFSDYRPVNGKQLISIPFLLVLISAA
jgi:hypothetical protein